jgi:hypothetical protein
VRTSSIVSRVIPLVGAIALAATSALAQSHAMPPSNTMAIAAAPAVSWSGVYRVQLEGKNSAPAAIVVERTQEGLAAIMLIDEHGTPLSRLKIDGDSLSARVATGTGEGILSLRIDGQQITGTLKVGKEKWNITGQRTA